MKNTRNLALPHFWASRNNNYSTFFWQSEGKRKILQLVRICAKLPFKSASALPILNV
jgi:hypothetical protein